MRSLFSNYSKGAKLRWVNTVCRFIYKISFDYIHHRKGILKKFEINIINTLTNDYISSHSKRYNAFFVPLNSIRYSEEYNKSITYGIFWCLPFVKRMNQQQLEEHEAVGYRFTFTPTVGVFFVENPPLEITLKGLRQTLESNSRTGIITATTYLGLK